MIGQASYDLTGELEAWCSSYIAAFERFDVPAMGAHWTFPAIVVSGPYQGVLKDAESFDKSTSGLTAFYERQNVRRVERTILSSHAMVEHSAAMRVHDVAFSVSGDKITEWVSAYVLRKTDAGWRAIFADATGEAEAWAALGTPLGSK